MDLESAINVYTISNVCDFYQRRKSVISDFSIYDSETLDKVHSIFCMHMYGCELWNLNSSDVHNILHCLAQSKASYMEVAKHYS